VCLRKIKYDKKQKEYKRICELYVPELMQLVNSGDEKMCLMMAQLEYWFGIKPDGFYKFMTIPERRKFSLPKRR
jgi:hypothetical protein